MLSAHRFCLERSQLTDDGVQAEFEEATEEFTKAISFDAENSAHFNNRGLAHYSLDKYDDALQDFDEVCG